jgi:hypothetical protein
MAHYKGVRHPNEEPRSNSFRAPEKQSKFTEEVAAAVEEGDTYLCLQSPAGNRYAVTNETGETIIVTHKAVAKYNGKVEWEDYDPGVNLVINLGRGADTDTKYAAMSAIEQAIYQTPLGRAVGRDGTRPMVEALMQTFGIDVWSNYVKSPQAFTVDPDAAGPAQRALIDLLTWAPENGYSTHVSQAAAEHDVYDASKPKQKRYAEEYDKMLDGEDHSLYGKDEPEKGDGLRFPFLSDWVYYGLVGGKDAGRSFKSRIEELKSLVGVTDDDVDKAIRAKGDS